MGGCSWLLKVPSNLAWDTSRDWGSQIRDECLILNKIKYLLLHNLLYKTLFFNYLTLWHKLKTPYGFSSKVYYTSFTFELTKTQNSVFLHKEIKWCAWCSSSSPHHTQTQITSPEIMPNAREASKGKLIKPHSRLLNGFSCHETLHHLHELIFTRQNLICCRQD